MDAAQWNTQLNNATSGEEGTLVSLCLFISSSRTYSLNLFATNLSTRDEHYVMVEVNVTDNTILKQHKLVREDSAICYFATVSLMLNTFTVHVAWKMRRTWC